MANRKHPKSPQRRDGTSDAALVQTDTKTWAISRRDFFKTAGLAGTASLLGTEACLPVPDTEPDLVTTVLRPEDLLFLRFEFSGLELVDTQEGKVLSRTGFGDGYIVVHFQPQHIFEEALEENPAVPYPAAEPKPVGARIAGASRVALRVPSDHAPIPYTSQGLLEALGTLEMSVAPAATPPPLINPNLIGSGTIVRPVSPPGSGGIINRLLGRGDTTLPSRDVSTVVRDREVLRTDRLIQATADVPIVETPAQAAPRPAVAMAPVRPRVPLQTETSLEVPYRLILSPNRYGGWAHHTEPDQGLKQGRHELWHTRLGTRQGDTGAVSEEPSYYRKVRAIWTRDHVFDPNDPFSFNDALDPYDQIFGSSTLKQPLLPRHRAQIVTLSSNSAEMVPESYTVRPIDIQRMMLSSLGAWLDASVDFGLESPLTLVGWDHQAAMGRDYFVKVVEKGRLCPWGHKTLRITITERKFLPKYPRTAYLWQRTFLRCIEPHLTYPSDVNDLPYKAVTVKSLVTPDLTGATDGVTKIMVGSDPFRFKLQAIDRGNNVVELEAPATWVPMVGSTVEPSEAATARTFFDQYGAARVSDMSGQRVAYAPANKKDDTTFETTSINHRALTHSNTSIPFVPGLEDAELNVEAIRHLLGQGGPTLFEYHPEYVASGFEGNNAGEALFKIKGGTLQADFSGKSDSSGGFVDPSLSVSAIGRKTGLISGDSDAVATSNQFNPADFLPDAYIFGVISLKDILLGGDLDAAPKFITKTVDAVTGFLEDAQELLDLLTAAAGDLAYDVTSLTDQLETALDAIGAIPSPSADDFASKLADAQSEVLALSTLLQGLIDDALDGSILFAERQDLKRRAKALRDVLLAVEAGLEAFATGIELAKNLTVRLEWRTPLTSDSAGFFVPKPGGGFMVAVEVRAKQVGDKPPGADVVAGIEKFDVNVFGTSAKLVTIPFKHLLFKVESGRKPEVDVMFEGEGVGFDGILAFVEMLSRLIPGAGFSDPPALEVDAEGIRASFSIPIPSIAVGVFAMQNMRLGAGFEVPFIGNPLAVKFNFCTREEPFVMTIMMIGGGGFVGLSISPKGMLLLEAALEARAQLAVDFGVASGSISIAAGIYFKLEVVGGQEQGSLTGYLRFQGQVDVLGLISASITLLLELIYEFASKKLVGRATLTIEVSIAVFSITVEVKAERKLAGSNDDPTFAEQMGTYKLNEGTPDEVTIDPWAEYLGAFVLAA